MPRPARWRRLLPGVDRLSRYERSWLRGDVVAGVTVAAYLVPQVMAYAEVAGLPAVVGLWAVLVSLLVYAAVGSSRQLSVGPESTTALLTATVVAPMAVGDPARYAALAAALALVVGALCLLAWALRLGFVADLLSKPVLVGYLAGVGVLVIVGQLGKVTGVQVEGDTVVSQLESFVRGLGTMHGPTVLLSSAVLVLLFVGTRVFPRAPVPLAVMLLAVLATTVLDLREDGVQVVGEVATGLPRPGLPAVSAADLAALLLPAVGVMVVAYTDNVLTARAFAARNGYRIDANQELLALGGANLAAGFTRTFPVSSSGSRTVVGDALGSRSQLHSLVAVLLVVVTLFVGGPLLAAFPIAALGAIVIWAATRLIEVGEFRRIARFRRSELILALATTAAVLAVDILYGVLIAVALSILDLLRRVARPHDGILGYAPGVAGMHDIDDYPDARTVPGLVVYRYDAPLCFANSEDFARRALASVELAGPDTEWFVLNAEANTELDLTSADALDGLREELGRRGIVFGMARVKQDLRAELAAAGLVGRIGEDWIFPTLPTAVAAYVAAYSARHGGPPEGWQSLQRGTPSGGDGTGSGAAV
jgi:sulfate permease, SulP family